MVTRAYGPEGYSGVTEFDGLSTDDKPTENVANGSRFVEMDSGKLYLFDAENTVWYPFDA